MNLFRGRMDVFPKRWDNLKTGKSGYSPACSNEWISGRCNKPRVKCSECPNQAFIPLADAVVSTWVEKILMVAREIIQLEYIQCLPMIHVGF